MEYNQNSIQIHHTHGFDYFNYYKELYKLTPLSAQRHETNKTSNLEYDLLYRQQWIQIPARMGSIILMVDPPFRANLLRKSKPPKAVNPSQSTAMPKITSASQERHSCGLKWIVHLTLFLDNLSHPSTAVSKHPESAVYGTECLVSEI